MTREKAIEIIKKCKEKRFKHTFYTVNEYDAALDMAIKALEQEPCEDAISRQAVLDLIADYDLSMGQVVKGVHALPPITPLLKGHRWIPVSERLPENGQIVLFCDIDDDIMIGYHVKGRPDTHFSQDGTFEDMKNVRAWMSLPLPYNAESEE